MLSAVEADVVVVDAGIAGMAAFGILRLRCLIYSACRSLFSFEQPGTLDLAAKEGQNPTES